MKVESEKVGLKLNIQKTKIMASSPITSREIDGETVEIVSDFILGGSKITADGDCSHEMKRRLLLGRKVMTNLDSILKSGDITLSTKVRLVSSVQFSHLVVSNSLWPHESQHARPPCPSPITSLPKPMSIELVMPSSYLILCPLLLPLIPPFIMVFSNESTLRMRWTKYWTFSFSMIPSKEHPGLISFRTDWLDLLAKSLQGTLKSLLQHYSSKASILWHSAFCIVQLSHPYITTGKTHSFD